MLRPECLLKALGLEADKDVAILQVGGSPERAAAFRTGRIAGFTSPPGTVELTKGMPHRILVSMGDLPNRFPFPYVCVTTTKSYLASNRSTVKRIMMALIDGTHFFKTQKEESKKIFAKYSRQNNEGYLEAGYQANTKLFRARAVCDQGRNGDSDQGGAGAQTRRDSQGQ